MCYSVTNLKYWSSSERIINKTLQLLSDLSVGYSSVRKLVKLEAVQFVLHNHTVSDHLSGTRPRTTISLHLQSEHFPFLGVVNGQGGPVLSDMRCRTVFYTALGRLLMVELGEDEEKFEQFMLPLTSTLVTSSDTLQLRHR